MNKTAGHLCYNRNTIHVGMRQIAFELLSHTCIAIVRLISLLFFLISYIGCSILIPLLFALIFWASNGKFKIKFVDALYVCVSAVTGTGLTTIDLSSLTAWQQVIIVFLELVGNQVSFKDFCHFLRSEIVCLRHSWHGSLSMFEGEIAPSTCLQLMRIATVQIIFPPSSGTHCLS